MKKGKIQNFLPNICWHHQQNLEYVDYIPWKGTKTPSKKMYAEYDPNCIWWWDSSSADYRITLSLLLHPGPFWPWMELPGHQQVYWYVSFEDYFGKPIPSPY